MRETASGSVVAISEAYYDSDEADQFYFHIWGGEDIHIGVYEHPAEPIPDASRRTIARMADQLDGVLGPDSLVLDLGAGYGGAGRYLARKHGCKVQCLNLSETQNQRNREYCQAQGLSQRVEVVHGNFEHLPFGDAGHDVVWSQDAILHSGDRRRVLAEARRVLRPGGSFIFTDPMQADDCPPGVLQPVLDRIHLESLGSFAFYRESARQLGFEEVTCLELTGHLRIHYARVAAELRQRYDEMCMRSTPRYVDRMLQGLQHWVDAADRGYLAWGILHFRVPRS